MRRGIVIFAATALVSVLANAHGDVAPQPVDTAALPDVGEEWLIENPYRSMGDDVWRKAIEIGASGYNQNCARCHGLGAVSGGLAPDLRFLEAEEAGDEWYAERYRTGYTQNGVTKMPAFDELLGQKAAWAIRTYVETRPDEGALDDFSDELKDMRDRLTDWSRVDAVDAAEVTALQAKLDAIAKEIETGSGAPVADSVALQALLVMDGSKAGFQKAAEVLTIGLSAAQ